MNKLLSNRDPNQSLPESFILPPEQRPTIVPKYKTIPVIDLGEVGKDREAIVQEIIKASEEFGFFQVINHGIPEQITKDMMGVGEEFYEMPIEDKMMMYSEDPKQVSRLYSSIDYDNEETHYWRDSLRHPCHPVENFKHMWPSKPTNYREVTEKYSSVLRDLSLRLLDLIGEGLGVGAGYFHGEITRSQTLSVNQYPPCPDPSLTLGLPQHSDPNVITVLLQGDVSGLQFLYEGEWIGVETCPNAFIINLGHQLQFISNGRLKSAEHRVVTNSKFARTTVGSFIHPSMECFIQPAEELVNEFMPSKFKAFTYAEFMQVFLSFIGDSEGVLNALRL